MPCLRQAAKPLGANSPQNDKSSENKHIKLNNEFY